MADGISDSSDYCENILASFTVVIPEHFNITEIPSIPGTFAFHHAFWSFELFIELLNQDAWKKPLVEAIRRAIVFRDRG